MPAPTTPLVITVLYTDRLGVSGSVLVGELQQLVVPIVNVRRHPLPGRASREIIFAPHKVPAIEGSATALAIYVSGPRDAQVRLGHGMREASIMAALHLLYDDTDVIVVINDQPLSIKGFKPRMVANGHDEFQANIWSDAVQAIRSDRLDAKRRREADDAKLAELDKSLGLSHNHKPCTPVTHYI